MVKFYDKITTFKVLKMPGKRLTYNIIQLIYYNRQLGRSADELSKMFSVSRRTVYNVLNRAEKENRLELKHGRGRRNKINPRAERFILRKLTQNPKISTRELATELEEELGVIVCHETVRKTMIKNKYSSRAARKKPLLSAANIQKRFSFAVRNVSQPVEYWDDVIFCDETKIMLYYNDGPSRVWRKPLTSLKQQNIIPTVKFGKMSIMIWGCISSHLTNSARKFGFIRDKKQNFKFYQDNDPKHKSHMVRMWLLYNCGHVIDTPAQSPDLNPIENLWVFLKKRVAKRQPTNMASLKTAISEEWLKIPTNYDLKKLVRSMKNRLQCVVDAKGFHTKY